MVHEYTVNKIYIVLKHVTQHKRELYYLCM